MNSKVALRFAFAFGSAVISLIVLQGLIVGAAGLTQPVWPRPERPADARLLPSPPQAPAGDPLPQGVGDVYCVTPGGGGPYPGCDQVFADIQAAIDAAAGGEIIKVAQGTYTDLNGDGRVVYLAKTVYLRGGYDVSDWSAADPELYPTILDGEGANLVVRIEGTVKPLVMGFDIRNGLAGQGGGIYIASDAEPILTDNRIHDNTANNYGGGIYISGGAAVLERNRIYDNAATQSGGGIYLADGEIVIWNNVIYTNTATSKQGGGIYVLAGSHSIRHNVLYDNAADNYGGGIYIFQGAPLVSANIIAQNSAAILDGGGGIYLAIGIPLVDYNDVWGNVNGNYVGLVTPTTDIQAAPLFVNAPGGDFKLQEPSPCIDHVPPTQTLALDFERLVRPFGPQADIGAYEFYTGTCFVRIGNSQVYTTVQEAVLAADSGSVLNVAGHCTGSGSNVVNLNKTLTLQGGYTLTNWANSDPLANPTILDGEGVRRVVNIADSVAPIISGFHIRGGSMNAHGGGIYVGTGNATIQGNWIYSNTVSGDEHNGAGIYLLGGSPTIQGNDIYGNSVLGNNGGGGGICVYAGTPTIVDNSIHDNQIPLASVNGGGGVFIRGGSASVSSNEIFDNSAQIGGGLSIRNYSTPHIQDNAIWSNSADIRGGGIIIFGASPIIESNQIYQNSTGGTSADSGGGGIYVFSSNNYPIIRDNLIYDNVVAANTRGGAFHSYAWSSSILVERNTMYDNSGGARGGAIYVCDNAAYTLRNNVIYDNSAAEGGGIAISAGSQLPLLDSNTIYANTGDGIYCSSGNLVIRNNIVVGNSDDGVYTINATQVTYSDVYNNAGGDYGGGAAAGVGTLSEDPLFVDGPGRDLHLQGASGCIDKADPTNYPLDDRDGYARPLGEYADMGAYEYYSGSCFAQIDGATRVYTTVQAAIDAAAPGALVKVAGLCEESSSAPVASIDQALTLRGGYTLNNWIAASTIATLDGLGTGRAVYIAGSGDVTVDGFVLRNGDASSGGGLYLDAPISPRLQNLVFVDNSATFGGGFASVGGSPELYHNTFFANSASQDGGAIYIGAGTPVISNSIVVSNTAGDGGGVFAAAGATPVLAYNDVWHNTGGDYGGDAAAGATDFAAHPRFVDPAAGDLHLSLSSPCIHAGDPRTTLAWDLEGDPRPLGRENDVGADESATYPDLILAPDLTQGGIPGQVVVFPHFLTNTGSVEDVFYLTHTMTISGSSLGWGIDYRPVYTLDSGAVAQVPVTIYVSADAISGTTAVVVLTGTSQVSAIYDLVTNTTIVNWNPGVYITPAYSESVDPGTVMTYVHSLFNSGNASDTFSIASLSSFGWATVTPTQIVDLAPRTATTLWVRVDVPPTAPSGLTETTVIVAQSVGSGVSASVTDTTAVNHTTGPRYVSTMSVATDTLNNCLVITSPCRTVLHASQQAANGDVVQIAGGIYEEHNINLNKDITLRGGYGPSFDWQPDIYESVVDAMGQGRVFHILGSPTLEWLTVCGGQTNGSGAGVYIELGSPIIRHSVITANHALQTGGGIYNHPNNNLGQPVIEQNVIAANTAAQGAGMGSGSGDPRFWNNMVYNNAASNRGGGMYVLAGSPRVWNNTFYGNAATNQGGGIFASSSPWISNTIVVQNENTGIFGNVVAYYCDVWGNSGGDYGGGAAGGAGSFSADPAFVDPLAWDLHLQAASPCVDVADSTPLDRDFDRDPRPMGDGPDVGADELIQSWVMLEPNNTGAGLPGDTVYYNHVLTNTGYYTDTFTFSASSEHGWSVELPEPVHLGPWLTATLQVGITIPGGAISGTVDTTVITATSSLHPAVYDTAIDTTTVQLVRMVMLEPDRFKLVDSDPGGTVDVPYTHTLYNLSNFTDTFDLIWENDMGWDVAVNPSVVTVGGGQQVVVDVVVTVPPIPSGTVLENTSVITAVSQTFPDILFDPVTDTTYVNVDPAVLFTPNQEGSGLPNETIPYDHVLQNLGNYTDTFTFSYHSSRGWQITPPPAQTLLPGESIDLQVQVRIPQGALSGTVDVTVITATSQFSAEINDFVIDTTTVERVVDLDLVGIWPSDRPGWCVNTPPTETVQYLFQLTNRGNWTDTFSMQGTSSHDWPVTLIPDVVTNLGPNKSFTVTAWLEVPATTTMQILDLLVVTATSQADPLVYESDSYETLVNWGVSASLEPNNEETVVLESFVVYTHTLTNTGFDPNNYLVHAVSSHGWPVALNISAVSLAPGESAGIVLTLTVPLDVISTTDTTVVTATTTQWCETTASAHDTTIVARPHVTLDPDYRENSSPGRTMIYHHVLSNSGAITDSYSLVYTSSLGWVESVTPTFVANLAPGITVPVTAVVIVPPDDWLSGTIDVLVITATSQFTDTIFDTAVDETVIPYLPSAVIIPDGEGVAMPGGVAVYTHTLINTGNYTDVFDLTTASEFGYSVIQPTTPVELGPGESYDGIVVSVALPIHAAAGDVELTEVIATFSSQQAVAVDSTLVLPIPGVRYVATDGVDEGNNCTILDYHPCATVQHAVEQSVDGDQIRVASGVYNDTHLIGETRQVVYLNKSVELRGGYSTENWETADPVFEPTVLDAAGQGRVIYIAGPVSPLVEGFRIRNGSVIAAPGAGIYAASQSEPTLRNNWVYDNVASGGESRGGGFYYDGSGNPLLERNSFYGNAAEDGAGLYLGGNGSPTLWNNVLYNNTASDLGGGIYLALGNAIVWNNTLYDNSADTGGGLYMFAGSPTVSNTIIAGNTGYGAYAASGAPSFDYDAYWANTPLDYVGLVSGAHSLITAPLFIDADAYDLHLRGDSPCIDVADPRTPLGVDRDGNLRPLREGFDIGAYEYGLSAVKRVTPSAAPGELITYTLSMSNFASIPWLGVTVTDTIHPLLGHVVHLEYSSGYGEYITATRSISWSGDIGAQSFVRIAFSAVITDWVAAGTPITNVAWVNYGSTDVVTTVVEALPGTRYVAIGGADAYGATGNNCLVGARPCATVQYGVDQALTGDQVWVAQGTYYDELGGGYVAGINKSIALIGGHAAGSWAYDPALYVTTLDAQGATGATIFGPATVELRGFSIVNGTDGVWVDTATATVGYNRIYGHSSDGLTAVDSDVTLASNWVYDNGGDGVDVGGGAYELVNNVIAHNLGAGLRTTGAGGLLVHDTFAHNGVQGALLDGSAAITNTIFYSEVVGVEVTAGSAEMWNTIWWQNQTDAQGSVVRHDDIPGDPLFEAPMAVDYHIRIGSAAIDGGLETGLTDDVDGGPRPLLSAPDVGADEYPLAVSKHAPATAGPGEAIGYALNLQGDAAGLLLTDTLSIYLDYVPGSVSCNWGTCDYLEADRAIVWSGDVSQGQPVTITYTTLVTGWLAAGSQIFNDAQVWFEGAILNTAPVATTILAVPGTRYVAVSGMDVYGAMGNNCLMSSRPCATLQYGVDQALDGDAVWAAQGTYYDELGAGQVVAIDKSIALVGGHAAANWAYDPAAYPTTMNAMGVTGVQIAGPATVELRGWRVVAAGDGVRINGATALLSTNWIYGHADDGVYALNSAVTLERNWLYDCLGDGAEVNGGSYTLVNNIIASNNNVGLRTVGVDGTLLHNTFAANGVAGLRVNGSAELTNSIFAGENVGVDATTGSAEMWNTIWWDNLTDAQGAVTRHDDIFADPLFLDPAALDYHIAGNSPAVGAGLWVDVTVDVDGDSRPGVADIGADQYPLQMSRLAVPDTAAPCEPVLHGMTLANLQPTPLAGVLLEETLPPEASYVPGSLEFSTGNGWYDSGVIYWNGAIDDVALITYTAQINPYLTDGTPIVHQAVLSDPFSIFDGPPVTVTVATLDVEIAKLGPAQATIGEALLYTVVYTVPIGHSAYQPTMVDELPRLITNTPALVYVPGSGNPPPDDVSGDGGTITWELPTLMAGCSEPAVGTVTFEAEVQNLGANDAGDALTNEVDLSYTETDASGPAHLVEAEHTLTLIEPEPLLSKAMAPSTDLGALDPVSVDITLENAGAAVLYDLTVTDTLPVGLTFLDGTPGYIVVGQDVIWSITSLATGGHEVLTITAQVDIDVGAGMTLTNQVTLLGSSQPGAADQERTYSAAAQDEAVTGYPDLAVSKVCGSSNLGPNQPITYTIAYTNVGLVQASGVTIADTLPLLLTDVISASSRAATATRAGQVVTWSLVDPLDRGVSGRIWITATVSPEAQDGDVLTNTVLVATTTEEPNLGNNEDVVITPIGCIPVSAATFSYSPLAPQIGDEIAFVGSVAPDSFLPIDYTWDLGDGTQVVQTGVMSTTTVLTYAYSAEGSYLVVLTAENACGQSIDQKFVIVNPHRLYLPIIRRN
ncbi:MAG: right-handed parallel beta-helix repeat-containing protein [Anaerolineae bacterium]|nr:right-handed parallel beta-helix repeat-containing protein [Anaerolineae bacterium]